MLNAIKKYSKIIALCFVLIFAIGGVFGLGNFNNPSTYYQTGEIKSTNDNSVDAVCFSIDRSVGNDNDASLHSVFINFGGLAYGNGDVLTVNVYFAVSESANFIKVSSHNFKTDSIEESKVGCWQLIADKEQIGENSRNFLLITFSLQSCVKVNEIAVLGEYNGNLYTLKTTSLGSGIKNSAIASLNDSTEFGTDLESKKRASKLTDENKFDVSKLQGYEYSQNVFFTDYEVSVLESVNNFIKGNAYGYNAEHVYSNVKVNPLTFILSSLGVLIFGGNTFGLRIIPYLFTLGTVYLLFLLLKKLFNEDFVSLISCAVFGILAFALRFAYMGTVAFTLAFSVISLIFATNYYLRGLSLINPIKSMGSIALSGLFFGLAVATNIFGLISLELSAFIFAFGFIKSYKAHIKRIKNYDNTLAELGYGDKYFFQDEKADKLLQGKTVENINYKKRITATVFSIIFGYVLCTFVVVFIAYCAVFNIYFNVYKTESIPQIILNDIFNV